MPSLVRLLHRTPMSTDTVVSSHFAATAKNQSLAVPLPRMNGDSPKLVINPTPSSVRP
jgi:hypothetical protein